jgi:hypothetical protein
MAREILVPLKSSDRIEDVVPYIEKVAQAGMKVVFFIPYPANGLLELIRDHWVEEENRSRVKAQARNILERYSREGQNKIAEARVAAAQEALAKKGVDVEVKIYTESLHTALETRTHDNNTFLVLMRKRMGSGIGAFLRRMRLPIGSFKRPVFRSSTMFLIPGRGV